MDYRLPTTVVPKRYDLRLEPDLAAATFLGEAVITVDVETTLTEIMLNAAELLIQSASVAREGGVPIHGAITLDAARLLNIQQSVGSLEAGRRADIVILSGEPFAPETRVERGMVDGAVIHQRKE